MLLLHEKNITEDYINNINGFYFKDIFEDIGKAYHDIFLHFWEVLFTHGVKGNNSYNIFTYNVEDKL